MKSSLMNWKRLKLREIRNPEIETPVNNECKKAVCCMVDGLFIILQEFIASLLINTFETVQQSAKDKEDMTKLFVN